VEILKRKRAENDINWFSSKIIDRSIDAKQVGENWQRIFFNIDHHRADKKKSQVIDRTFMQICAHTKKMI
jgi:hypothetical protein